MRLSVLLIFFSLSVGNLNAGTTCQSTIVCKHGTASCTYKSRNRGQCGILVKRNNRIIAKKCAYNVYHSGGNYICCSKEGYATHYEKKDGSDEPFLENCDNAGKDPN